MDYDNVNNPKHYAMANKHLVLEPIDICEKYSFCQGNAIKYLLRYENKNGAEDLKKALWYLNRIVNENLKIWYPDGGLDKALIKQYEKSHPIAYMVMRGYINNAERAVEEAIAKAAEPLDKAVKTELNKKKTLPEGRHSLNQQYNLTFENECLKVLESGRDLTKVTLAILKIAEKYVDAKDKTSYIIFLDKVVTAYEKGSKPNYELFTACINVYYILVHLLDNDTYDDLIKAYKAILENETGQLITLFFGE